MSTTRQPRPPRQPMRPCPDCGAMNEASNTRCRNCQAVLAKLTPAERKALLDEEFIARLVAEAPLPTPEQAARIAGYLTYTTRKTSA